jgi:hypothetical protein
MPYHVTYRADGWVCAVNGVPELRQVITTDLSDGTYLVVVVVRSVGAGSPRVAEARIEQAYVTRSTGWKRRTIKRLPPQDIELAELRTS